MTTAAATGALKIAAAMLGVLLAEGVQAQADMARTGLHVCITSQAYWCDHRRGWHFYEEPPVEVTPAPATTAPKPAPPKTEGPKPAQARPVEIIAFEQLQQALEQSRQVAIMRPTEANVRRYMLLEAQVMNQASAFADMAQSIAWASPELDPSLHGRPVNAKALEVFDQVQANQRSASIGTLGRDHVLIFFFRGDCPYCHAFAPTLKAFEARFGIRVVAVSVDGGALPGFEDARRDNGTAAALRVAQVPAVYLAQPYTGRIAPVGFGVLSQAQLVERLALVAARPEAVANGRRWLEPSEDLHRLRSMSERSEPKQSGLRRLE